MERDLGKLVREEHAVVALCTPSRVRRWRELAREACAREELDRAERYRYDHLRRRFLCGRVMLRHLLGLVEESGPAEVRLHATSLGQLLTASSSHGLSVSYSDDLVAVLIGPPPVGLDLARPDRTVDPLEIADLSLRASELAELEALDPPVRSESFVRLWVQKEAVSKALGRGLSIGFDRLDARRVARAMGARLSTLLIDDCTVMATVIPDRCRGVIRTRWMGDPPSFVKDDEIAGLQP